MPRLIRNTPLSVRDPLAAGPFVPLALLLLTGAYWLLDAKAQHVAVPMSYADQLHRLRSHIQLVRERLSTAKQASP